ncbi:MAG: TonB-dependent receptor [Herminiimonas sp.]|nr:TonB-dependent receptor [Herminiimonas sp.]
MNRSTQRRRWRPPAGLACIAILVSFGCARSAHAQTDRAKALELPTVEVIGTTLLPGLGTSIREVPANVQVFTQRDLARQRQGNLAEYLEQNATSLTVNAAQGNPFQPEVSFRGFTASPLLGVPQGLSVFQDGVRINEPFGDVVNWDLIPQSAIASIQLIPGSNPAFGLNTLGGALAVYTKSGSDNPGGSVQITTGSFGRRAVEFEHGGKQGAWDYFFTGNLLRDRGWADHNPSRVGQFFGKVGYQDKDTDLDLSLTAADNTLEGTQTLPASLSGNIRQAYTYPDKSRNKLALLTLKGSHFINDDWLLGGNLYYRDYRNASVSSNVNNDFGAVDPGAGKVSNVQAINDRSSINQGSDGLGLQLTYLGNLAGSKNQLVIGASADLGRARFTQEAQPAQFTPSRGTQAVGDYAQDTDAATRNRYYGVFVTDTLSIDARWSLTLSGRYNLARIAIEDRSGSAPELNGRHTFSRFNPAAGLTFNPTPVLTFYGTYNEGMRAPTPIELTCADPADPCKLPNNFLSDPPLRKVVSRNMELGARGKLGAATTWSAAVYRTRLSDDIQFISSQGAGSNTGYFQNVGETKRQGLELAGSSKFGVVALTARYSYIDATYQSAFLENSPANSTADASGSIAIKPGNRLPGIPRHNLKLRVDYDATDRLSVAANLLHSSATYARGDENNLDARGKVPGYTVVNLDGRLKVNAAVDIIGRVNNLLDREYANFGLLGRNVFTGPNRSFDPAGAVDEQFRGYGTPRGVWIGVRYSWL